MPNRAPLPPERIDQINVTKAQMGYAFSSAVQHHWKSATFTTWAEAVEELRSGIVATVNCYRRGRRSAVAHQIRFSPDGSIELLGHPGGVDEASERMLAGLGASMATCTAVALCFPARTRVGTVGLNTGARQSLDGRLRMLWAAVTWAQDPNTDWSQDLTASVLRHGVGREEAHRWVAAGWPLVEAQRFWKQWAPFETAEQWRQVGRTDQAAAVAAGLGQAPEDDQRWLAAGFTPARAARWRKNSDLSPEQAIVWESLNTPPSEVPHIERLARTMPGLTMDVILDWCRAGVPARQNALRAWWEVTGGDKDLSVRWAPTGIGPAHAYAYEDWNADHPDAPLTPVLVGAYQRAGFATAEPLLVAAAHAQGVTPATIKRLVASPALLPDALVGAVHARARTDRYAANITPDQVRTRFKWWLPSNMYGSASLLIQHLSPTLSTT